MKITWMTEQILRMTEQNLKSVYKINDENIKNDWVTVAPNEM
jgi:hypothetical protein